jgi:predicted metalloprotease
MRWKGRRISTNVEDRRGGGAKAGGISILGLIVADQLAMYASSRNAKRLKPATPLTNLAKSNAKFYK